LTDTFSLQSASLAANAATVLLANAIEFKNLSTTIDAKGEQDTVNGFAGVDWTLGGTHSVTSTNGYTFNNVETVDVASQTLNGTDGDDAFTVNASAEVGADSMVFKHVATVAAGTGTDNVTTTGIGADLTGSNYELKAAGVTFNGIETASLDSQKLTGTDTDNETFEISTASNRVAVNGMNLTSVAAIDAGSSTGDEITTTESVNAELTGTDNELTASGINFSAINNADLSNGALSGSDNADTFELSGVSLLANNILFSAINSLIDAKGGNDQVTGEAGTDWNLTEDNNQLSSTNFQFQNIETADLVNESLVGTDTTSETFEISTVDKEVTVNGMNLTSVAAIDAGSSTGDKITTTESVNADLTAADNALTASGIKFTNLNSADLSQGQLTGTNTENETFEISTTANQVAVNGMNLTSVAAIDAGSSTGDEITTTESVNADLTAADNALTASGIDFTNVNSADLSQGQLTGTDTKDETFEISTAANQVAVNGMNLTSVAAIDAGSSATDAITTTELVDADLTAADNALTASGINFTNVNSADLSQGQLTGTDTKDETFDISTAANQVVVNGMNLTSVAAIDAGSSTGDEITTTESVNADLTAADNALTASGIDFTNVNSADLSQGQLTGTDTKDETFEISTADKEVTVNGMNLTSVAAIDAGSSTGDKITTTESVNADLTAADNALTASGIKFTNLNSADLSQGQLTGTNTENETFEISTTANQVAVNGMNLTSVAAIDAGSSTGDEITTTESVDADLTTENNAINASGIKFTNVNSADLSQGQLTGTDAESETFEISTAANQVAVNGMNLTSVGAIDAGSSATDAITTTELVNADLTAENNALTASGINFTNVNSADLSQGQLTGTDAESETFEISTAANAVAVNGMNLTSVAAIDAGASTGDAITTTESVNADLTAENNALTASSIKFTNVNSADLSQGQLTGTDTDNETFEISTAANQVAVNGMNLTAVGSIDAGSSIGDGITTTELVNADLTTENNALTASGIDFKQVNSADLSQGQLTGTDAESETFEISTAANQVAVNGMNLTSVAAIDAGTSTGDAITTTESVNADLTATDNALIASGIKFTNVNSIDLSQGQLTGTDTDNEIFEISTTANQVAVNGMNLTSVAAIDAGSSTGDEITTTESVDAKLTGTDNELTASGIDFSAINNADLSNGALSGSDNADTFELFGASLLANNILFSAINSLIDAKGGNDQVTGEAGTDWNLTEDNKQLSSTNFQFQNIEKADLVGTTLIGTNSKDETFEISTADKEVTVNGMNLTSVAAINAGSSAGDAITTTESVNADLTAADNALTASGIKFTNLNSADLSQGQLTGTNTENETFEISTTANQVAVNGMNLTSVAAIDAGSSTGDEITTTESVNADLTAADNALTASGIDFTNVNSADLSQGQLTGTDTKDETFEISTAANQVAVNGMNLTSVAAIDAGSSATDAITTTELVDADLTAADNALTASGINFTNVNSADLSQGQLTGTDTKDETFDISTAANQVVVNGMNLTSVAAIDAGSSAGDAITTTELVDADLTTENNALTASGIKFTNVNSADLSQGQLTGTDTDNEIFEISTTGNQVAVNGMNLTSVAAIDAGASAADAITAVVAVNATLAAAQKALTASNIAFTNINAANLNSGALNGTNTEAETFQISTALNQVNVNGIDLTNVSAIDAGTDLGDTVVTTELVNAALTSDTNALTASGINFSGLDSMDLSQGVVTGTDSSETFEISNTNNAVTVNGMSLTAVSAVNAGSSTDDVVKVATGVQATADLTAVDNQILASAITFNDVDTVNLGGGTLNGSNSENEVYVVNTTANALAVKNMQFESVNAVNGGADSIDSIATLGVAVDAQLTGADKQLLVSDITFSDISSANMSGGRLSGSDEADTIQLTSAGMAANEINFYLINSAVDTQGGDDTVIGRAGVDWTLTGTNGEINSVRYQFKNVENVDVVSEGVAGSAIAETFELGTEESQVIVNQLTLSNVSTVTADLNDTLLGTSGDDVFNVNSDTSVLTNSTTFDGMENLNGGEGQDTLISNVDGLAWIINQASDGVNSLGDFLFSQFEVLNNNVGNLNLSTSLQAVFAGESVSFIGGNSSTASIQAVPSDMNLNFNGQEDVIINSTYVGKNAITGNLIAHLADINASGDIDLDTEIDILNVSTNDNRSINATFVQNGDLVLRTVDVGDSGTVILDSAVEGTGLLTTETRNEVNFVAKSVSIGTGKSDRQGAGLWEGVGSAADASQLTFDVSFNLDLEALYYVTPFFPNGAPITSQLEGIESDSLISSQQSALIITDTVQNLAQLDPAIFESLTPYIADANSIAGADNYYASSEVPSTLDTAQLAALLSSYEPTAAGGVNYDEYKLDGESEEDDDEKKKLAKKLSKAGTFVADDNSDIKVAYSESGEMLGVVKDYVFQAGDSLWSLSKRYLGNGFAWTEIAKQNPSIKNPSSIADGQIIKVVVKVSDEIGQILKSAISAGGISKEGNSATLPASLRREVALP
jgi:pyruvate formate-lyase activating enzyme-like uncharacterized protein